MGSVLQTFTWFDFQVRRNSTHYPPKAHTYSYTMQNNIYIYIIFV